MEHAAVPSISHGYCFVSEMDTKAALPTILFAAIVACHLFTASSARYTLTVEGGDDGERYTGALRLKPDGKEQTMTSTKFRIELCQKLNCGHVWKTKTCYCCNLLNGQPCFWDQKVCWDTCPNGKLAPLKLAPSSAPADQQQFSPSVAPAA